MRRRRPPPVPIPPRPDLGPPFPATRRTVARPGPRLRGWPYIVAAILLALIPGLLAIPLLGDGGVFSADHGAYAFLETRVDGSPYRWDPCRPILYQVNLDGAPGGALTDAREAARRASDATGITFVFWGETERTPEDQWAARFHDKDLGGYLPVLISWEHRSDFSEWANPNRAGAIGMPRGTPDRPWVYRSGLIVVNADQHFPAGFATNYSLGPVLMHEWGHVLGLAHVGDADELMWSDLVDGGDAFPNLALTSWGPGDRQGLAELGRRSGCLP